MDANGVERARPVVAVLAEGLGNHGGANEEKDAQTDQQNDRGTDQMARVVKKTAQTHPP